MDKNKTGEENPTFESDVADQEAVVTKNGADIGIKLDSLENGLRKESLSKHKEKEVRSQIGFFPRLILAVRSAVWDLLEKRSKEFLYFAIFCVALGYNVFLGFSIAYAHRNNIDLNYCDDVGFLIIITAIVYWALLYYHVIKPYFGKSIYNNVMLPVKKTIRGLVRTRIGRYLFPLLILAAVVTFLVIDSEGERLRLVSAGGALVIIIFGFLISKHPGRVNWNQVMAGILLQFCFGLLILRWPLGRRTLDCIGGKIRTFLDFTTDGSSFVFGFLASGNITVVDELGSEKQFVFEPLFYFGALSVIYFFSFVIGMLYHIGAMTWIVALVGWCLQITIGTTAVESMNAAGNIFLGMTEAPITIKPFIPDLTSSELNSVMTGGFATIAGSVMAAFISFGIEPAYLLSASLMAAPAALAFSKLVYPETHVSITTAKHVKSANIRPEGNVLDSASQAAIQAITLISCIGAILVAFIAFVAFLNAILGWLGELVGFSDLSFEWIVGKIFIPVAYCLGIDSSEVEDVAVLLGLKTVVNEFVAYQRMATMTALSERSKAIATFALCSFANFAAIGIQLGAFSTLAPSRRHDFSRVVWTAFISGTCATILNGCVAGSIISSGL